MSRKHQERIEQVRARIDNLRKLITDFKKFEREFAAWIKERFDPNFEYPVRAKLQGELRLLKPSDFLCCSVCKGGFVRDWLPIIALNCNHLYHRECFARLLAQQSFTCIDCGHDFFGEE